MAGYSGTPLVKKLGVKEGFNIHLINAPAGYRRLLSPLPAGLQFSSTPNTSTQIVHVFATERARRARTLTGLRKKLAPDATIWVSWPKQSSKVSTDITENTIREVALPLGFVDIKV